MCETVVGNAEKVCVDCFKQLEFIIEPFCKCCSTPFVSQELAGKERVCLECETVPPLWSECRASFVYNEGIKKLILQLKYADQQKSVGFLTEFMRRNALVLLDAADYIIPIPLHKKRLRQRKYNQSALLAWRLKGNRNVKVVPLALVRKKETQMLGRLSREERKILLMDAFMVNPAYKELLHNKRVILVDDVVTTGATLSACSRALLESGVARIDVIVAVKVIANTSSVFDDL